MDTPLSNIGETTKAWAHSNSYNCQFAESCESTNDWAKKDKDTTAPFELFVTNHQSKGRGRGSNEWVDSSEGNFLLSTWSYTSQQPPQHITGPLVGLAVYNACRSTWSSLEWSIKAPNDIYLADKKVGGILLESVSKGPTTQLFIGLGLNVLAGPKDVPHSTYISSDDGTGGELSKMKWMEFLGQLDKELQSAVADCEKSTLPSEKSEALVEALNFNPLRPGLVVEVSSEGDIILENETLKWQDL